MCCMCVCVCVCVRALRVMSTFCFFSLLFCVFSTFKPYIYAYVTDFQFSTQPHMGQLAHGSVCQFISSSLQKAKDELVGPRRFIN